MQITLVTHLCMPCNAAFRYCQLCSRIPCSLQEDNCKAEPPLGSPHHHFSTIESHFTSATGCWVGASEHPLQTRRICAQALTTQHHMGFGPLSLCCTQIAFSKCMLNSNTCLNYQNNARGEMRRKAMKTLPTHHDMRKDHMIQAVTCPSRSANRKPESCLASSLMFSVAVLDPTHRAALASLIATSASADPRAWASN